MILFEMKQRQNKSLLKTNYNSRRVVISPEDSSQLTKFKVNRLVYSHVADVKTGFLKTGFDNTISCLAHLNSDKLLYQNTL